MMKCVSLLASDRNLIQQQAHRETNAFRSTGVLHLELGKPMTANDPELHCSELH